MKKVYRILIWVLIVTYFFSCSRGNEKRYVINDFPQQEELKGEHINKIHLQKPRALRIIDSILVIINREGTHFFEYYERDNFELLGRYGNKGRGPGEFISPTETGEFFFKSKDALIITTYDWIRRRINYINLHESIVNKSYICNSETFPNDLVNVHRIIFNNDSLMGIIPDNEGGSRFFIYDKMDKTISRVPFIPELLKGGIHNNNQYYVYNTYGNCVSVGKQYFIASPVGNGQMDFFDFNGNYLKTIHLKDNEYLQGASSAEDVQTINGFNLFLTDIQVLDERIFLLLTVIKLPDLKAISESKIYVFDLDGNPKSEYILDKEIHRFTIDPINKRFLGFSSTGINGYQLLAFNY